jgi:hypothetical protein
MFSLENSTTYVMYVEKRKSNYVSTVIIFDATESNK